MLRKKKKLESCANYADFFWEGHVYCYGPYWLQNYKFFLCLQNVTTGTMYVLCWYIKTRQCVVQPKNTEHTQATWMENNLHTNFSQFIAPRPLVWAKPNSLQRCQPTYEGLRTYYIPNLKPAIPKTQTGYFSSTFSLFFLKLEH